MPGLIEGAELKFSPSNSVGSAGKESQLSFVTALTSTSQYQRTNSNDSNSSASRNAFSATASPFHDAASESSAAGPALSSVVARRDRQTERDEQALLAAAKRTAGLTCCVRPHVFN
eukprot:TRINITY_DN13423_c0_g1_i1.p1 TRINITY_DN13423_c0_g1~~TRINITY_DN13423_c0_g1_i1.p1  ORF type:complete len:116 (-),score=8.05 TRINITY_DN13423_c0_g1_i1:102-449(-)